MNKTILLIILVLLLTSLVLAVDNPTYCGNADITQDGEVDWDNDYLSMQNALLFPYTVPCDSGNNFCDYNDINRDGVVNNADEELLKSWIERGCHNFTTTWTEPVVQPAPSPSGDGGGGGGGGICTYNPDYDWGCTEWSDCVNGEQTRTCKAKTNNCGSIYGKPAEIQSCTVPAEETPAPAGTTPGGLAGITGAVIGALGTTGTITIILVVIAGIIGTAVSLSIRRFRKKQ